MFPDTNSQAADLPPKGGGWMGVSILVAFGATATVGVARAVEPTPGLLGVDVAVMRNVTDCGGRVIFEQPPDGVTAFSSEDHGCGTPANLVSEVADDFVGDGQVLVGVSWWGVHWNGAPAPPNSFTIRIYLTTPEGLPEEPPIREQNEVGSYHETFGPLNGYCADIDPFPTTVGVRYFVSIIANQCQSTQWGWASAAGGRGNAYFRSAYFGPLDTHEDWTPCAELYGSPLDMAFRLRTGSMVIQSAVVACAGQRASGVHEPEGLRFGLNGTAGQATPIGWSAGSPNARSFRLFAGFWAASCPNCVLVTPATPPVALRNALLQNTPNPFNPATTINYTVARESLVRLYVYDVTGRKVKTLVHAVRPPGEHWVLWDGQDDNRRSVASGVYFYQLETSDFSSLRKMVLLK